MKNSFDLFVIMALVLDSSKMMGVSGLAIYRREFGMGEG